MHDLPKKAAKTRSLAVTKDGRLAVRDAARLLDLAGPRPHAARSQERVPRPFQVLGVAGVALVGAMALVALVAALRFGGSMYQAEHERVLGPNGLNPPPTFKSVRIYDRHGTLLWEFFDPEGGRRVPVRLSEVSQHVVDATLAAEDAHFFDNPGFDPRAMLRALLQNVQSSGVVSGASTLTQQLARNVFMTEEERTRRTILRKLRETALAYELTEVYPKEVLLEMYLNEIYYGHLAYGIEAAALTYFGKHARDLTLGESALLAGLPQAPSTYDPFANLPQARARQAYVLDQMVRYGFVSREEADAARAEPLVLHREEEHMRAPHWVMYIRSLLEERYGARAMYERGLQVRTSLDLTLQEALQRVVQDNVEVLRGRDANNAALVAIDATTNEILAMVGSRDYWDERIDGQVNVALALRQPGSALKPFVYLAAFKRGWTPATVVDDVPTCFNVGRGLPKYCPDNFDSKFYGPVTIRDALGNSLNIPAVKALEYATVPAVVDLFHQVGLTSITNRNPYWLSLTLGGAEVRLLDLTNAYSVFPNLGRYRPPVAILEVADADGNVIETTTPGDGTQVVDPRLAYMITHILTDRYAHYATYSPTNILNTLPRTAAWKTGTTDNYRDTWTIGYTPDLVVGVWLGNTDNTPTRRVWSSVGAGKIWAEAMQVAWGVLQQPAREFERPEGLVDVTTCAGHERIRPNRAPHCWSDVALAR